MHRFTLVPSDTIRFEFTASTPASLLNVAMQRGMEGADAYQNEQYLFSMHRGGGDCWVIQTKADMRGKRLRPRSSRHLSVVR